MAHTELRKLPKRLRIDFRSTRSTFELYSPVGCTKRDLLAAGLTEELADALVWNSHAKKIMRHTLVSPEEWFWTDRDWWGEDASSAHLTALYEIAGGSFSDLTPPEQATLLGTTYLSLTGRKKGNRWSNTQGGHTDIVRYMHYRLTEDGYEMAPAYSENINLLVRNHCQERYGRDITFIDNEMSDAETLRRLARLSVADFLDSPEEVWDRRPQHYERILNGFRRIKDFDKTAMLETLNLIGRDVYSAILSHYWNHQTYQNQMSPPHLPPLVGRRNGHLEFFYVTQKASFRSDVSRFIRDYALPLKLNMCLVQLSPVVGS